MKFKKLKIKNIRSYEHEEIEFPQDSVLLSGDIGSGKTSILMAIEYGLFGLQPGQKGTALLRNKANLGEVSIEIEIDGNEIIIERRLKREGKSVSNDYSAITINGVKTETSVTELKNKILTLLKYPPEFLKKNNILYRYTVYTPQEQMKQIILEEPEARLNILGHVFGVDRYKKTRENLSIILNKIKEDSKVLQGEIKTLDQDKVQLESTKSFIQSLHDKVKAKEEEIKSSIERKKVIELELLELEKKTKEKELFEKEVEKTNLMISSKKENLSASDKELSYLLKNISEEEEEFSADKLKQCGLKIQDNQKEFEGIIQKVKERENEVSTLKDKIKEREIFEREVDKTKIMIASKRYNISVLDSELFSLLKHISEEGIFNEDMLKDTNDRIISKKEEIEKLNEKYTDLSSRIRGLEQNRSLVEEEKNRVFQMETCQTCLQKVPHEHKYNIKIQKENQLNEITKNIFALEQEKKYTELLRTKSKLELPVLEEEGRNLERLKSNKVRIEKDKQRAEEIKKTKETLEKDIYLLSSHTESLKGQVSEFLKYTALLKAAIEDLEKIQHEKNNLEINLAELKSREALIRSKISFIQKSKSRVEEINKTKETLEKDISFLSTHLESMKDGIFQFSKFSSQLKLKQIELEKARSDEKIAEISFAELKKEIEMTQKEIHNLQNIISVKDASRKKLSGLLELGDWLSTQFLSLINFIERNVMIKLRVEFEKLFAKWFNMLAGEPFEVHLDENFTPLILQGETEMEYSFLSGGERTAIALAYRLALNQTINSVLSNIKTKDIIILDEPTDGFSEVQLSKMREVLKELKIGQLIIVSHEQKIEDFVDNVVKLSKQGHTSSIEHVIL